MPVRIQRKRSKGWRMPEGAVYVGRPTMWGNTFRVVRGADGEYYLFVRDVCTDGPYNHKQDAVKDAVRFFDRYMQCKPPSFFEPLRGKNLACWCPPGQTCHADVLLRLSNTASIGQAASSAAQ
jgi:hypothetical protein